MSRPHSRLVAVGVALQSAKGAAAAEPQFLFGVKDGKPAQWEIEEDAIEVTGEKPLFGDADRTGVVPGAEFTSLVHPKMAGLLLFGALGGIASSGSGGEFEHVITPANDLPYLTFFGRAFGGDYLKVSDCKIDELELSWENAGHISIAITSMGLTLAWGTTPYDPEVDESTGGLPLFRAAGGSFKVDVAGDTPVERNIISGSLTISNNAEAIPQSGSVQPSDINIGVKNIEANMNTAPDDLLDIRKALTAAAAGTGISNVPVYGSFEWEFVIDAETKLSIDVERFQVMPEMPDADPSGSFLENEIAGQVFQPEPDGGDHALVATLSNDVEEYADAGS